MNRREELVSVLTPSFNQGQFIGDCLASVAAQSYGSIEHIVYDGGSTDQTLSLLRANEASKSLVWVTEADAGQSDALNKAFRRSSGRIVGWLNSDDAYAAPYAVSRAVDLFSLAPDAGVVYGNALLTDARGLVLRLLLVPNVDHRTLVEGCYIYQPSVFMRRSVLEEHGFVRNDLDFAMDYELWLRLSKRGVKFVRTDDFVAIDRHHPGRKVQRAWGLTLREVESIRPHRGAGTRIRWRVKNLLLREVGLLAMFTLYRAQLLPVVRLPSVWRLFLNQLAVPRARLEG